MISSGSGVFFICFFKNKSPKTSTLSWFHLIGRWSADNSAPRRLHHVRLTGERPGTGNLRAPLVPSVLVHPSMHSARRRQQLDVGVHVGHRVAPHAPGLLQIGLALLLHQRGQRPRLGGVVVLSDGDLRLGQVA